MEKIKLAERPEKPLLFVTTDVQVTANFPVELTADPIFIEGLQPDGPNSYANGETKNIGKALDGVVIMGNTTPLTTHRLQIAEDNNLLITTITGKIFVGLKMPKGLRLSYKLYAGGPLSLLTYS